MCPSSSATTNLSEALTSIYGFATEPTLLPSHLYDTTQLLIFLVPTSPQLRVRHCVSVEVLREEQCVRTCSKEAQKNLFGNNVRMVLKIKDPAEW